MKERTLFVVLGHGAPEAFTTTIKLWQRAAGEGCLLLVHGGKLRDFEALDYGDKVWVDDPRLRTRSHPVERQSYCGAWREVARWVESRNFDAVYWAEFDELPLVAELGSRLTEIMSLEKADVLARRLKRVDGTNDAHWLYHEKEQSFREVFEKVSCRDNPRIVLSMLGTGSLWKRKAFLEVAEHPEGEPCYLELFLPTMAHHLGYRVRDFGEQSRFIGFDPKSNDELLEEIRAGAWTVHPVKGVEQERFVAEVAGL